MSQQNVIDVAMRIHAQVDGAQQAVNSLKQAFGNLKLSDSLTKSFETDFKNVEKLAEKYKSFQTLASSGKLSDSDMKELVKTSQEYEKALDRLVERWKSLTGQDLLATVKDSAGIKNIQQQIDQLTGTLNQKLAPALAEAKSAMGAVGANGSKPLIDFKTVNIDAVNFKQTVSDIQAALQSNDFQQAGTLLSSALSTATTESARLQGEIDNTNQKIANLNSSIESTKILSSQTVASYESKLQNAKDSQVVDVLKNAQTELNNFSTKISDCQSKFSSLVPKGAQATLKDFFQSLSKPLSFNNLDDFKTKVSEARDALKDAGTSDSALRSFSSTFNANFFNNYIQSAKNAATAVDQVRDSVKNLQVQGLNNTGLKADSFTAFTKSLTEGNLSAASTQLNTIITSVTNRITELQSKLSTNTANKSQITVWKDELSSLQSSLATLTTAKTGLDDLTKNFQNIQTIIGQLNSSGQPELQALAAELQNLSGQLTAEQQQQLAALVQKMLELGSNAETASNGMKDYSESMRATIADTQKVNSEIEQVVNRFARFTTLAGIMDIFRRSIRAAFDAVKELDEAMNSIAVVTDMTTQDLWNQVDVYTAMANETGSTIAGAYQVAQLYYQQGLSTNDVMVATTETLKLARVAGIEYAEATDYKPEGYVA